jgi:hypothetical protein
MHHYARAEVSFLWFLDPSVRVLEIYRRETDGWKHVASHAEAERVRAGSVRRDRARARRALVDDVSARAWRA